METGRTGRVLRRMAAAWILVIFLGAGMRVLADCSSFGLPFTDLGTTGFCAQIAEAYYTGLSNGTSATTYSPSQNVPREQMAAFVTRTLDKSLSRGNRRSALQQFWNGTPRWDLGFGLTTVGGQPLLLQSDGTDIWVPDFDDGTVYRVRAGDGSVVNHWTGATGAFAVLIAMGRIFVLGITSVATPSNLYMIDPSQAPGVVSTVANGLGAFSRGITFDGTNIWTANTSGSVSIVTPGNSTPWSTINVMTGFSQPGGTVFDGSNVWITDAGDSKLKKLDGAGNILQSVTTGTGPSFPAFDGTNIWVPNQSSNSVTVVRASTMAVVATLTGNGLSQPTSAAFDGQRILITNQAGGLSVFQATTLSPIGNPVTTGLVAPVGACSDGTSFWVSFAGSSAVGRF